MPLSRRAKKRRHHEHTHFMDLPRVQRRNMAVALRWRIAQDVDGGGVYFTDQFVPGSHSWVKQGGAALHEAPVSHWADVMFMSRKPIRNGLFYNAAIQTVAMDAFDRLEDQVDEVINAKLTEEERSLTMQFPTFKKVPGSKFSEMIFAKKKAFASLDGLTCYGFKAVWMQEALDNIDTIRVQPKAKIETDYAYGLGLHMVVDEVSLDASSLPRVIERFLDRGEQAYCDTHVAMTAHLPGLRAMIRNSILTYQRMDAHDRGVEPPPAFDINSVDPLELRHYGHQSVGIKM